jgi:ATP-dependent DNA helicase RecG
MSFLGLSVCRNPKLAAIFYRLQLIEAYGMGMPKIMKAYASTGMEPKIEVTSNVFKLTLPNRNIKTEAESASVERGSNEERILKLLAKSGYVVRSDVDRLLGISQTTANRILKRMVAEGLTYQEGSGKNMRYK